MRYTLHSQESPIEMTSHDDCYTKPAHLFLTNPAIVKSSSDSYVDRLFTLIIKSLTLRHLGVGNKNRLTRMLRVDVSKTISRLDSIRVNELSESCSITNTIHFYHPPPLAIDRS